jgi:hypothetical protein
LFMCFKDSDIFTRLVVGSALGAIAMLIIWCIQVWMAWKRIKQVELDPEPDILESINESRDGETAKPPTYSWTWPTLLFRRSSCDSDVTAV